MRRAKEIARGRGEVRAGSRIKYFSSSPLPSLPPPRFNRAVVEVT